MIKEQRLESIFCKTQEQLHKYLIKKLKSFGYEIRQNKTNFVYAEGSLPVLLVAHLDTVHKKTASFICKSKDGIWTSPDGIGGDDRCGVELILSILDTGRRPSVLFTHEEEVGGNGAEYFTETKIEPNANFIVEFDRKGNKDAVFYDCDNTEFTEFVKGFGFEEEWGTFSDISVIAPHYKVAAVNLSSGYYNAHTQYEYVSIPDMNSILERSLNLIDHNETKFEYIESIYDRWSKYYGKDYSECDRYSYGYGFDDFYNDYGSDYWATRKSNSDSENETENSIALTLMEIPLGCYIMAGEEYFDSCDAMFYMKEDGKVYVEDYVTGKMSLLEGAYAYDSSGNNLRYDDKAEMYYEGDVDTISFVPYQYVWNRG